MTGLIRLAAPGDGPALQRIERRAGERFREIGRPEVADDEPATLEQLAAYAAEGRAWVAVDDHGARIGYVLVDRVDGRAHIEQISVLPDHQGRGIGRALLDAVRRWAVEAGMDALTLTTFRDVAWNAPLYRHLGFVELTEPEIGPELRALRAAEAAHGLDPAERACMRLDIVDPDDPTIDA